MRRQTYSLNQFAAYFSYTPEHSGHQYGFDDYTGWTEDAADYYGVRNGKCSVAYASVLELATDSSVVNLSLSPNPTPVDIDISASNYSRLTYSPLSRASSGRVDFDHVISGVNLYAKLNTTTLATLAIKPYAQVTGYVCVVKINGQGGNVDFSTFNKYALANYIPSYTNFSIASFTLNGTTYTVNSDLSWTKPMLEKLRDIYYTANPSVTNYAKVQFLLQGNIASSDPHYITLGMADAIPSRDSWISQTTTSRTYPHELGHCLGLVHRNSDKDALMCQSVDASDSAGMGSTKLRHGEWDDVR
jgi:hypothetical protein